jgi:hypothetical protein
MFTKIEFVLFVADGLSGGMATWSVSEERLTHFRCSACKGWWSIGDAPEREAWFCPWCGLKLEVEPKPRITPKPPPEAGETFGNG